MKKIAPLCALALIAAAQPAFAEDSKDSTNDKPWMVRVRALGVLPDVGSSMNIADSVKINNSYVPEFDVSYFITPNVAVELIAAVTKHNVTTKGGVDAGSAWLLPPTLTLQYHFNQFQDIKPYVGAGVNYTHFYDESPGQLNAVKYDDSFGGALQAGFDVPLGGNWYANADVKKVYINTTAKFSPSGVRADVNIDPWLMGVGIGYRF